VAERPLSGRRITQLLAASTGGVGTHVRAVLGPLAEAGASVTVCAPQATDALFGFSARAAFSPVGIPAGLAPFADARAVAAVRRALAGADLVHAHGWRAGLVAAAARGRARGVPLVLSLHTAVPPGRAPRRRVLALGEAALLRAPDVVLAASADLAGTARRRGAADVREAPVAAPALPPVHRPAAEVRAGLGLAEDRPLVLAVGRLHPQKGHDVLLEAAAHWQEDRRLPVPPLVAIAGDGPLAAALRRRIRAERLPVVLLGRRDDVADLLAAADVVVQPSRWEARSLAVQEALRAGRPLVATRTGGLPALVGDAADLVPVGDAGALADAVTRLLTDPAHARALAAAGPRRARGWPDEAATAAQLVALYRELLGGPAS
jgi:glycosyltransferase involved in cell wall biosynthesis